MTDVTIQIDMKTRAIRSDNNWVVQRMQPTGKYDMVEHWTGNRRSLLRWLETNKIYPTRQAEQQINALPERRGFREDEE